MSAEPLNGPEREARTIGYYRTSGNATIESLWADTDRWEATVQAAEEQAEDWMRRAAIAVERTELAEGRAERLRSALVMAISDHTNECPCVSCAALQDDTTRGEG